MDLKQIKKLIVRISIAYWLLAAVIYFVAGDGFRYANIESESLSPSIVLGEIGDGVEITQSLVVTMDRMDAVSVYAATYGRTNSGYMNLAVTDSQGIVLTEARVDISGAKEEGFLDFVFSAPVEGTRGKPIVLHFTPEGCSAGNAITFFAGNTVEMARATVEMNLQEDELYRFNGQTGAGKLCVKTIGINNLRFYLYYWPIVISLFLVGAIYSLCSYQNMKRGRNSMFAAFSIMLTKYRFLIKQLVSRDFKTKYKRSALGVAWSFLNPLMTMFVQYLVFSTLFKSSVPNFPVYLLTGTVFFSFFNEAISMGMSAIVGNASLIKKVYVPKYIYPISRVLSSLVNFVLAFAPLLLVMIVTRTAFRPALLLLVYDIFCFFCFITGMVLILSTEIVFFQDIQFLWGVVSMLWMYLTPIFYPESIIPEQFLSLYHLNPLYQYINFARTCIIYGISPHPEAYLGCLLPAVATLVVGAAVFRKEQSKFVMYV